MKGIEGLRPGLLQSIGGNDVDLRDREVTLPGSVSNTGVDAQRDEGLCGVKDSRSTCSCSGLRRSGFP